MHRRIRELAVGVASSVFSEEFLLQARWELTLAGKRLRAHLDPRERRTLRDLGAAQDILINLGSGPVPKAGWLNVDAVFRPDVTQHLGRPLALPDGCARAVFSEHVLEHLAYPTEVRVFLSEAYRLLADGGTIRLIVPDAEKYIRAYAHDDHDLLARLTGGNDLHPMEALNRVFRERTFHRFAWDYDLLRRELERAGFSQVRRAQFRDSSLTEANVDFDQDDRRLQSLYVEAQKSRRSHEPPNRDLSA